jgi:hypothetical protein
MFAPSAAICWRYSLFLLLLVPNLPLSLTDMVLDFAIFAAIWS